MSRYLLGAVLLLALLLRLPLLDGSFWLDEAAQALESARPLSQQFQIGDDFQPPLIHLIIHFALYLGKGEWYLRTVGALIPGLISIWATYKLGEKLFSKNVGLLAALFLATSSWHIFYSQELRPYSLPVVFALLSWLSLLNQKPKFYTLLSILGLYSSYLYPFLMLSQLVYVWILNKKLIKSFILSSSFSVLAFLPWLPKFLLQLQTGQSWRVILPGWEKVVATPQFKVLPLILGKFIYGVLDLNLGLFYLLMTLFLSLIIIFIYHDSHRHHPHLKSFYLLLIFFFVPLLSAWAISFVVPVLQAKRVLYLLPAFYLLIASSLSLVKRQNLVKLLLSLILTINLYSVSAYYTNKNLQRENWRALHSEIVSKYPSQNSIIVFSFNNSFAPWRWYDQEEYEVLLTGAMHISQVNNLREKLEKITNYDYVLVFDYLRDLTDPDDVLLREIEAFDFRQIDLISYPNLGFVRVYGKTGSLLSYACWY